MEDAPLKFPTIERLAPFVLKSRAIEVGRDRLLQIRSKLAFLLITTDIAENSRDKLVSAFDCPVYQALTMEDVARLFKFQGTKVVGFRRSPLCTAIQKDLKGLILHKPTAISSPSTPGETP